MAVRLPPATTEIHRQKTGSACVPPLCIGVSQVGQDVEILVLETYCTNAKAFPTPATSRIPLFCSSKAFSCGLMNSLGINFLLGTCLKGRSYQRDTMAVFCVEDVD